MIRLFPVLPISSFPSKNFDGREQQSTKDSFDKQIRFGQKKDDDEQVLYEEALQGIKQVADEFEQTNRGLTPVLRGNNFFRSKKYDKIAQKLIANEPELTARLRALNIERIDLGSYKRRKRSSFLS
jgi:hypothetical protein